MKTLIALSALVVAAWGYSAGAPESVCDDMTPKHPVEPQKTPLPYNVAVSRKEAKAGDIIDITISGKIFKGFLLEVRNGDKAVGSFIIPDTDKYAKTINCHGTTASAATHKNAVEKDNLTLKWKAPEGSGNYQVFVTIAEDGGTFWARQPSQKIKIN
ncbi:Reeler domain containing protein [Asbolus verrucosus]|uniref:Reeler domain containing protein n=1 Tax=Asbolus verrucosus TaxID=1661398 RepID=A0A482VJ79_ASBVE|nr:Reeler domain containing protein [Asbolus verrucosus]